MALERLDAAGYRNRNTNLVFALGTRGFGLFVKEPPSIEKLSCGRQRKEQQKPDEERRDSTRSAPDLPSSVALMHPVHFKSLSFG